MQSYRGRKAEQDQGYAVRDKEGGQSVDSLLLFFSAILLILETCCCGELFANSLFCVTRSN